MMLWDSLKGAGNRKEGGPRQKKCGEEGYSNRGTIVGGAKTESSEKTKGTRTGT